MFRAGLADFGLQLLCLTCFSDSKDGKMRRIGRNLDKIVGKILGEILQGIASRSYKASCKTLED